MFGRDTEMSVRLISLTTVYTPITVLFSPDVPVSGEKDASKFFLFVKC